MTAIRPVRVNHLNVVIEDFDAALAHVQALYGADFLLDLPQAEWHAGLVDIGRVIFELFAPPTWLLNARYGPHYLGIEYQADMAQVRAAIAAHGIRIARDIGVALHTHPADTLGIAFEFYDGSFHDNAWPRLGGRTMRSARAWCDDHPLGLTGLHGYTVAVEDIDRAGTFLRDFLSAEPAYDVERPTIAARAAGFRVADALVELIAPIGDGLIRRALDRHGQGIYSTVLGIADPERARRYFADRGITLATGSAPGRQAIPAERNLGLIFEFAQGDHAHG